MASTAAMAVKNVVLIPMKIDCFVFNEKVCTPTDINSAKISPITQPNYTFLRYDQKYLSSDILRHSDLHATDSAASNSRFTDLGVDKAIKNRQGIYVHWMLPRPYRGGNTTDDSPTLSNKPDSSRSSAQPKPPSDASKDEPPKLNVPTTRPVPTRWLVIRHLDLATVEPKSAVESGLVQELKAFVVESDHRQSIDDLEDSVDLQVDVSPFVAASDAKRSVEDTQRVDNINIDEQAEVFIGSKWDAESWSETTRDRVLVDLSRASNQLFADFQSHNSNVFSIVDNLTYKSGSEVKRLTHASVSYQVIGWHWKTDDDPFTLRAESGQRVTRGSQLDKLNMVLSDATSEGVTTWRDESRSTRVLCHGTNYGVTWDETTRPEVPADAFCARLMKEQAVTVGTTPLNSIITYIRAHKADGSEEVKKLMADILKLETQLIARDQGVEAEQKANNIARGANFKREDGGKYLYFADTNENTASSSDSARPFNSQATPSIDDLKSLLSLNQNYFQADNLSRLLEKLRWDMFSLWWSFLTDLGAVKTASDVIHERGNLRTRMLSVSKALDALQITNKQTFEAAKNYQGGVMEPFHQVNDPTLMVAGVPSGWPHDYLDPLKVRLEFQALSDDGKLADISKVWGAFGDILQRCIPPDMLEASECLVAEFAMLRVDKRPKIPDSFRFLPLYHDNVIKSNGKMDDNLWRDSWNGVQPFFPLFLEWEVEYTHIPFNYWRFQDTTTDPNQPSRPKYVVNKELYDQDLISKPDKTTEGKRICTGRSLILPQPSFSLEAKIKALFSQIPEPQLEKMIPQAERDAMMPQLRQLAFLSAPLTGFIDHLLTRLHGTHVKPNNRGSDGIAVPIASAVKAASDAKFEKVDLRLIANKSDLTPYGSQVQFEDKNNSAFKPVTHGQFRFTKLNILDKFGQAIHAIDPTITEIPKSKVPLTSDYYSPQQLLGQSVVAGKVIPSPPADYEYIQIPPQINQSARLNASFVNLVEMEKGKPPIWKPTTEWDNPVWGWVVINYANYGLQFFLSDGTFYREVRIGGPTGAQGSAEWLPFAPPKVDPKAEAATQQLQQLILQLTSDADYLEAFVGMIDACMPSLLAAPPSYAQNRSAVVGRPLALANTGWSLELATERYVTQVLGGDTIVPRKLAVADSLDRDPLDKSLYSFPVKLGSKEKNYDALVGYFKAKSIYTESADDPAKAQIGDALDLTKIYTYYEKKKVQETTELTVQIKADDPPPKPVDDKKPEDQPVAQGKTPIVLIDETNLPKFYPYYYDPNRTGRSPDFSWRLRCREQQVFGVLMDPFAAIQAYSSILPIRELRLPPWVVQAAFMKMSTFFTIGPILIPKDLPSVTDPNQVAVTEIAGPQTNEELKLGVPMPVTTLGEWNWLQPYRDDGDNATSYKRMKLEKIDQRARFEEAPYTVTEGYLQFVKTSADEPVKKEEPAVKKEEPAS